MVQSNLLYRNGSMGTREECVSKLKEKKKNVRHMTRVTWSLILIVRTYCIFPKQETPREQFFFFGHIFRKL